MSERQWATIRDARIIVLTAPRGIAFQPVCFALALWNGNDPILKERLFGLTGSEGNHGEAVNENYLRLIRQSGEYAANGSAAAIDEEAGGHAEDERHSHSTLERFEFIERARPIAFEQSR